MASLTAKKIRGHTYYYARQCKRVDGKPKIVWQKYLGRAEDIVAALAQPPPSTPYLPAHRGSRRRLRRRGEPL
jgi:hypothetical protein